MSRKHSSGDVDTLVGEGVRLQPIVRSRLTFQTRALLSTDHRSRLKPRRPRSCLFVSDQFANGRRLRVLNIVDDVTKECLGAIPDTSIFGQRVARELTSIVARRGKPGSIAGGEQRGIT